VGLGPSEKFVWAPSKGRSAKSLYTKSYWLSAAEWLGLGQKGLICTNDKWWYYQDKNICSITRPQAPFHAAGPH
jgi:hypothetical protein